MRITPKIFLWFLICLPLFSNGQQIDPLSVSKAELQYQQKWVDSVYSSMNLVQKVGQLFVVQAFSNKGVSHSEKISNEIINNAIGGLIFSNGSPTVSYTHLTLPTIYSV